jgi:putative ABC transport system ATP-binding protein
LREPYFRPGGQKHGREKGFMNFVRKTELRNAVATLSGAELSYPSKEGEVPVLRGVDIKIEAGEIVAVTGPSGSGKSSLIAVLAGLEKPTGGSAVVLDTDLAQADEGERTSLRRKGIGIVFQSFHLVPAMTALQNAALPLLLAGDSDHEAKAASVLERVGLGHRFGHRPSELSGGEQQRVAIARAFAASPRLILADEPTGNLDQKTGDAVAEVMFDLVRETGAAMLIVTHDMTLADRCDRVVRIDAGLVMS